MRHRLHGTPLHRRLFWWFGLSILMMGAVTSAVISFVFPDASNGRAELARMQTFVSGRFARVWHDDTARAELATALSRDLGAGITLRAINGTTLVDAGPNCHARDYVVPVVDAHGVALGDVRACLPRPIGPSRLALAAVIFSAGFTLWLASLWVARRIGWPLHELADVAREIGEGHLQSRVRLGWHQPGEVGALAESINDMASRIEKQLSDQRELVAAVSHEIRAPLSRIRVLTEMLRDRGADDPTLKKLEREIVEIDSLVGDLLASSRLDFSLMTFRRLDASELSREALDRAGQPEDALRVETADPFFDGDATLVARALANLLDNASRHGSGARSLVVRDDGRDAIAFEVLDAGSGFPADVLPRAFEPFQRGHVERRGSSSLGLGLALVRRIAVAHGGMASAENRPEGGARVTLRLLRRNTTQEPHPVE